MNSRYQPTACHPNSLDFQKVMSFLRASASWGQLYLTFSEYLISLNLFFESFVVGQFEHTLFQYVVNKQVHSLLISNIIFAGLIKELYSTNITLHKALISGMSVDGTVSKWSCILVCGNNIGSICNRKLTFPEMPSKQVVCDRFHIGFFWSLSMLFEMLVLSCNLTPVTPTSEDLPNKWLFYCRICGHELRGLLSSCSC